VPMAIICKMGNVFLEVPVMRINANILRLVRPALAPHIALIPAIPVMAMGRAQLL